MSTITSEQIAAVSACTDDTGHIQPRIVVEHARSESSPLHVLFEDLWNEERAIQVALEQRARQIIRRVEVRIRTIRHEISAPNYVRDPRVPSKEQGMISLADVRQSSQHSEEVLERQLECISGWLTRAHAIAVVLDKENYLRERLEVMFDYVLLRSLDEADLVG